MIRLENFSLMLRDRKLINSFDFSLKEGELTVLLGPNGAGKSTLMKTIAGVYSKNISYSGNAYYGSSDLKEIGNVALSGLRAVMSQNVQVPFPITVQDMVELGRVISGRHLTERENRNIVLDIMERVGITEFASRNAQHLSGGEFQRVQLARVLAQIWPFDRIKPVLFLDEPISSLDINYQHQMLHLVKSFCTDFGISVLSVLHDINIAAQYGDRLIILDRKADISIGTPEEIVREDLIREVFGVKAYVQQHPGMHCPQILTYVQ